MRELLNELAEVCEREGHRMPARATVYAFMANAPPPSYRWSELPPSVRATLHNVDPDAPVPGPQLVQRAFNAGDVAAISFASSLPWLCLYQASRMPGFRPKSLALLRAVMRARGIR